MKSKSNTFVRGFLIFGVIFTVAVSILFFVQQRRSGLEKIDGVTTSGSELRSSAVVQPTSSHENRPMSATTSPWTLPPHKPTLESKVVDSWHLQIERDGYDSRLLERFGKYARETIYSWERDGGKLAIGNARTLAAQLHELKVIAAEPLPSVTANVHVPSGPGGPTFSGMAPSAIKDLDRRKAYEAAIRQNEINNVKRSWLIGADSTYKGSMIFLEMFLGRLTKNGNVSQEAAESLLLEAKGGQP